MFTVLYWIFCLSFTFDFRGSEGGNPIQYLFLLASVASGSLMFAATPKAFSTRPTVFMSAVWWVYLASTVLVMMEARVSSSQYLRCVLPPLLCGLGLLVGQALILRGYTPQMIIRPLLICGIISVFWRFFHAIYITGIPIAEVRYEMLSPAIPLLFAAAISSAILGKQLDMLSVTGGALALASVMISITRSYLLTAAVATFATGFCFVVMLLARAWQPKDLQRKLGHFAIGVVMIIVTIIAMYFTQPIVFERWVQRLFYDGGGRTKQEVTYLTRAAEAKAMWELLEKEPVRFIYGKGLGATYYWHSTYYPELMEVYSSISQVNAEQWFPGHSVWTYALFSGGIYAVCCYLFLWFWLCAFGLKGGWISLRQNLAPPEISFLPFILGLCYLSQTITANPFGERFSAQILGIFAAMPQFFLQFAQTSGQNASNMISPSPHAQPSFHRAG